MGGNKMKQINFKFKGKKVYLRSIFFNSDWGFWFDFKLALKKPLYIPSYSEVVYGRFLFWYFDKLPYNDRY